MCVNVCVYVVRAYVSTRRENRSVAADGHAVRAGNRHHTLFGGANDEWTDGQTGGRPRVFNTARFVCAGP